MLSSRSRRTQYTNFTIQKTNNDDQSEYNDESKSMQSCFATLCIYLKMFINAVLFDIMFCFFIISQEVADQSNLSLVIMDAMFVKKSRVQAAIVS